MKIALAFSGGGARCVAQLGYVEVLQQMGIGFEALSGSSGGAIVASFLALGYTPKEVLKIIKSFPYKKIKLHLRQGSIFSLQPIIQELRGFGFTTIQECPIPLSICLTSYEDGETLYAQKGDLARAVMASSALLPLFAPVEFEGKNYIDGGFSDNLPITPLLSYPFRLAINVNPRFLPFKQTFLGNLKRIGYLLFNTNIKHSIPLASKYVEIKECANFDILDRKHFDAIYRIGKELAIQERREWELICCKR